MLAFHFLPIRLTEAFLKLIFNAGDSVYGSDGENAIELEGKGLNSSCPFSEATAEPGCGARCNLVDRVDIKNLDLQGQSTRLTRELFKKTDSGVPPKFSELGPRIPQLFCACQVPESGCPGLDSGPTSK